MSILMRIQHGSSWNDKNKIYADNTNGMWKANGRYLISFKKTNEMFSLTEQKMKHLSWDVNVEYLRWYNKRWKIVEWNSKRIVVDIFKFSRSLLCSIWSGFLVFFYCPISARLENSSCFHFCINSIHVSCGNFIAVVLNFILLWATNGGVIWNVP